MRIHVHQLIVLLFLFCAVAFAQDQSGGGPSGMQFSVTGMSGNPCNCSSLTVPGPSQLLGPTFINPPAGSGSAISNMSVNGALNVKAYGAVGNQVNDDTAAIQAAINAAGSTACVYFPAGKYLVTSDLNLTRNSLPFCVYGDDMATSQIYCRGTGMNACLDGSGADSYSIRNLQIVSLEPSTTSPRMLLLLARTNNGQGFGHTMENVYLANASGQYTVYDYGNELGQWRNVRSNSGPGVVFSECNRAGVTSRFQTLIAPPTSMSAINIYGGNLNAGGGINNCAVTLDNACASGLIHDINIWGTYFGEMAGGGTAICDMAGGSNQFLSLISVIGSRLEAADTLGTYRFINFANSYTAELTMINDDQGTSGAAAQPPLNFGGCVDESQLQLDVGLVPGVLAVSAPCGRSDRFVNLPPEVLSRVLYMGDLSGTSYLGDNGNYIQWFDGAAPFYGHVDAGGAEANYRVQTVAAPTSGNVQFSQPFHALGAKQIILNFNNYLNAGTLNHVIGLQWTFLSTPTTYGTCPAGMIVTTTQIALVPGMATAFNGQCIITGM